MIVTCFLVDWFQLQLRSTYGRSRYAVSAIKEIIAWKGCKGTLEVRRSEEEEGSEGRREEEVQGEGSVRKVDV